MTIMQCAKRDELSTRAIEVLGKLNHLTAEQIDCLKANDEKRLMELDKNLETAFGEKERAFGALRQHTEEHGC
jgi:hypothetical protein